MKRGWNTPRIFDNFDAGIVSDDFCKVLMQDFPDSNIYRFPGGTISNKYNINKPGYGDVPSKKGANYIDQYINFVKKVNGKALLVFNLFDDMKAERMVSLDANMALYHKIKDAAIEIVGVEIGNEVYMYPECTGVKGSINVANANVFQRKLQLFSKLVAAYKLHINEPIGVPFESWLSKRGKMWNAMAQNSEADAVIPHYYTTLSSMAQLRADFKRKMPTNGKRVWITEFNYAFGPFGEENNSMRCSKQYNDLHANFPKVAEEMGVEMLINHSLYGDNVYNWYLIKKKPTLR